MLTKDCLYDSTIRYDSVCLTCSKKLTDSQLSLPQLGTVVVLEVVRPKSGTMVVLHSFVAD